jgi:antitoxin VapB
LTSPDGRYILQYILPKELNMDTAKLFKNGQSQAVRLPKQYAFKGKEVHIKSVSGVVMLIPKNADPWKPLIESLDRFSEDFMKSRPPQGATESRDSMQ